MPDTHEWTESEYEIEVADNALANFVRNKSPVFTSSNANTKSNRVGPTGELISNGWFDFYTFWRILVTVELNR